ncbi:hypothetical protein K0A96_00225 [Patescibacteria group bacterium]|nr:hypothetical protein [Patescibacteria group bacterium]
MAWSQKKYFALLLSFLILTVPFIALGSFFVLITQIEERGFNQVRPLLISESLWPIIIIIISLSFRNYFYLKAKKEGFDKVLEGYRLNVARMILLLRGFLLLAAIPIVMRFLLNIDPSFEWVSRYLDKGAVEFFTEFF